jgi:hypothetical protein
MLGESKRRERDHARLRLRDVTLVSRLATLAAVLAVVATACASAGSSRPPAASHAGAAPADTLVASTPTKRFAAQGVSFRYPATWRAATWTDVSSFSALIVALSTTRQHNPCTVTVGRGTTTAQCGEPVAALPPGTILVTWSENGFPSWRPPAPNTIVGGHPARQTRAMASWCAALDGTQTVTVEIPLGTTADNWVQMDACLRAPDLPQHEAQLAAMLRSARIEGY